MKEIFAIIFGIIGIVIMITGTFIQRIARKDCDAERHLKGFSIVLFGSIIFSCGLLFVCD